MKDLVGQTVALARNYKDSPRPGILVRNVGTFYLNVEPPEGINVVIGRIEPYKRGVSYPYYDMFMNFDKAELLACKNEKQDAQVQTYTKDEIGAGDTLSFTTAKEARDAYEILSKRFIHCQLRGNIIVGIRDIELAQELIAVKPKRRPLYRRHETSIIDNYDDNFEI